MPVANQPPAAVLGQLVSMSGEQGCILGLDCLRQQTKLIQRQKRSGSQTMISPKN
jgi:hypothetical protein